MVVGIRPGNTPAASRQRRDAARQCSRAHHVKVLRAQAPWVDGGSGMGSHGMREDADRDNQVRHIASTRGSTPGALLDRSEAITAPMEAPADSPPAAQTSGCPFTALKQSAAHGLAGLAGGLQDAGTSTSSETKRIPGPRPLPLDWVENSVQVMKIPVYGIEEACLRYNQAYGKIVRFSNFGVGWTFVTDPEMIEHICSRNAKNYMERFLPDVYAYVTDGKGILGSSGQYNQKHRAMCKPSFQKSNMLKNFAGIASAKAQHMVDSWAMQTGEEVVVDAMTDMQRLTLDLVGLTAFSFDFGGCEQTRAEVTGRPADSTLETDRLVASVNDSMEMIGRVFMTPEPLLRAMAAVGEPNVTRMNTALADMRQLVEPVIQERRRALQAGEDVPADLMTALLQAQEEGERMSDDELWEDVHDVMGAGHETTANTLTAALWEVAMHPEVDAKIHAELCEVLGEGPERRLPTYDDYPRLTYTTQVIKETLRLYPSIPLFPRKVQQDDVLPGGYQVPGGDVVFMSSYALGRSPALWDEPYAFQPERFDAQAEASRHRFAYLPFGAGPRMCMGANFALMSTTLVLATIMQGFRFAAVAPTVRSSTQGNVPFVGAWRGGMPFEFDMTMRFPTGVTLTGTRR